MYRHKTIACVIPVRLASTRFPKKALAQIDGKPLIQWVWEATLQCSCFDVRIVAIDHEELADAIEDFGAPYVMTDPACASGTDRLVEIQRNGQIHADVWVNWQGDEPCVKPEMIADLLSSCDAMDEDIWTLCHQVKEGFEDPAVVKVVRDQKGKALYFSRSPLPYGESKFYRHVGLYDYSDAALEKIAHLEPTVLEKTEQLEQLRFLENGMHVQVHETCHTSLGVDLPEHLDLVEKLLTSPSHPK